MNASPVAEPPPAGRPLRLLPFRGVRLSSGRTGDPATARLFARPYRHVPERLARWRSAGQLMEDDEPSVYLHEYTSGGLTVRGLVAALDLSHRAGSAEDRAVVPHEGVHPEQVLELAHRMTVWQLNPAPILLVHRGPAAVRALVDEVLATPPDHEFVDRADQRHRVWQLSRTDRIDALNADLADSTALIADGHHRYAAYLRMQDERPVGTQAAGLAMLVDQGDTPLFLGAIHRVLLGVSLDQLRVACQPSAGFAPIAAQDAFDALGPDTLVATDGTSWATLALSSAPDHAAVETLHDEVIARLGLADRRIAFLHSVDEALSRVRETPGVAILLPAPDFDLVVRIAQAGRLLPEKATSFQPKPSVGVLMRSLHEERAPLA